MRVRYSQIAPTSYGFDSANSRGTSVSSGGSPGTFSASFVELAASTNYDAVGFWVHSHEGSGYQHEIKIYAGAAASETQIAHVYGAGTEGQGSGIFVPIAIPAGTRVSAKTSTDGYTIAVYVSITLVRSQTNAPIVTRSEVIGVSSGVGTNIDCGGTANTKGAWTQISASTTNDAVGYTLCLKGDESSDANAKFSFDIAVGAGGSEVVIAENILACGAGYRANIQPNYFGPIWTRIPAGTRIAVRGACSSNSAANRVPVAAIVLWG